MTCFDTKDANKTIIFVSLFTHSLYRSNVCPKTLFRKWLLKIELEIKFYSPIRVYKNGPLYA